jgi:hypothetical protein
MLGEILGRRAGETCTEDMEARFLLPPRAERSGVLRSEVVVEEEGRIRGDCVAEEVVLGLTKGEWVGWKVEGFAEVEVESEARRIGVRDLTVGVAWALGKLADSGSSKFSMWSEASGS